MISFEDALYIFGGVGDTGVGGDKEFGDTWRFDLLAQKWTKAVTDTDTAPPKRFHHTGVLHSNSSVDEFVVFGGLSIGASDENSDVVAAAAQLPIVQFNDVWRLQLPRGGGGGDGALTWVKDPVVNDTGSVTPTPRSEAGVVVHNDQMLVFGGITYDNDIESAPADSNELWSYNLSSCTWTLLSPVNSVRPPKRFSHSVTLVKDAAGAAYLVAFSGRRLEFSSWTLQDDTWLYSIEQNQWLYVASSSAIARAYTSLVSINAMDMWFFGGYYKPKQGPNGYVYDDVVAGKITLNKLLSSDSSSGASLTNSDVNRFTPQSLAIASPVVSATMKMYYGLTNTQLEAPALRYNHRAAVWKSCMVIHGGSYQTQRGDVWLFNTTNARLREEVGATLPMDVETLVYVLGGFIVSILTILLILLVRWRRVDRHQVRTLSACPVCLCSLSMCPSYSCRSVRMNASSWRWRVVVVTLLPRAVSRPSASSNWQSPSTSDRSKTRTLRPRRDAMTSSHRRAKTSVQSAWYVPLTLATPTAATGTAQVKAESSHWCNVHSYNGV